MAQVHRRGIIDSDNSPELLDIGLWQFDAYEPSSCYTASVLTPITPWPRSMITSPSFTTFANYSSGDLQEEDLHFKVAGVLMRQNLKVRYTAARPQRAYWLTAVCDGDGATNGRRWPPEGGDGRVEVTNNERYAPTIVLLTS